MTKETYKQNVFCTNCNFRDTIDIPRGIKTEEAECPNCGNKTLESDNPIQTTDYHTFE